MCLNDLLLERFVMIEIFPVGYSLRQFIQLLQIVTAMGIRLGVMPWLFPTRLPPKWHLLPSLGLSRSTLFFEEVLRLFPSLILHRRASTFRWHHHRRHRRGLKSHDQNLPNYLYPIISTSKRSGPYYWRYDFVHILTVLILKQPIYYKCNYLFYRQ